MSIISNSQLFVLGASIRRSPLVLGVTLACAMVFGACGIVNASRPFKLGSLQAAIDRAQPGDTVEIPAGTYREFIQITHSGTPQRPITIEATAGNVVITGADRLSPDRWRPLRNRPVWRYFPWTYRAPTRRVDDSGRVYSGEEVIVDGRLLSRAASLESMRAGTFFADPVIQHAVFVWLPDGSSPSKHAVEASVRPMLLEVTGSHIIVRNITFRYASNIAQQPAVDLEGEYNIIDNCLVEYTAGVGLHLAGHHNVVRRVTSGYNGQLGMGGNGQDNLLEQCKLIHNNTLDYPTDWEAGGIKVVGTERFRIARCQANENNGTGFWFDLDNRDGVIEGSYAADNTDAGIGIEIGREMTVRNNVAVRNGLHAHGGWGQAGILIAESMDSLVEYNICVANLTGIAVRQQGVRVLPASSESGRTEPVRFYSDALVFRHNISAFNRQWQFALFGDNPYFAGKYVWLIRRLLGKGSRGDPAEMALLDPAKWSWRLDHNVYFAPPGSELILWGAPWLSGHKVYDSVDAFRREHHLDQDSIVADPEFGDRNHGDFSLRPGSPAAALVQPQSSRPDDQTLDIQPSSTDAPSATVPDIGRK